MIKVTPGDEPPEFDTKCRTRGKQWLIDNPCPVAGRPKGFRPRDYWTPFKPILRDNFGELCGYSAMCDLTGTVDHFISVDEDEAQSYEWANYRYASGIMNQFKQAIPSAEILDPFEVEEGWFEISLPDLQMRVTDDVPTSHRLRAEKTLERFHLRDDERVIVQRRAWYKLYESGDLTLRGLRKLAPLIANAVEKADLKGASTLPI